MKEEDIIKIVKDLFNTEIKAVCDVCRNAELEGEEQFFNKLKIKLKKLFDDNDLSKDW